MWFVLLSLWFSVLYFVRPLFIDGVLSEVRVAQSLVFCIVLYQTIVCLIALKFIVLSVH